MCNLLYSCTYCMENFIMTDRKMIVWLNLFIGIYNFYLCTIEWSTFNIIIGSLNIGVWVFFRRVE